MSFLTQDEGRQAARDLLGIDGDCWRDGCAWKIGVRVPYLKRFLWWTWQAKEVFVWGIHQSIEEALVDAESTLADHERHKRRRLDTAQRARSGQFFKEV